MHLHSHSYYYHQFRQKSNTVNTTLVQTTIISTTSYYQCSKPSLGDMSAEQCPGSQNYTPFLVVWGAINPFTISHSPLFFGQVPERVKLYTQLKKSVQSQPPEHPGTTNYYCCLTHTDIQESLIIKINRSYSIAISFILTAPIQQTVQDNAPMLACPSL